jgi:hypothetical protein
VNAEYLDANADGIALMFHIFLAIFVAIALAAVVQLFVRVRQRWQNRWRIAHQPNSRCERAGSIESFQRLMRAKVS